MRSAVQAANQSVDELRASLDQMLAVVENQQHVAAAKMFDERLGGLPTANVLQPQGGRGRVWNERRIA